MEYIWKEPGLPQSIGIFSWLKCCYIFFSIENVYTGKKFVFLKIDYDFFHVWFSWNHISVFIFKLPFTYDDSNLYFVLDVYNHWQQKGLVNLMTITKILFRKKRHNNTRKSHCIIFTVTFSLECCLNKTSQHVYVH